MTKNNSAEQKDKYSDEINEIIDLINNNKNLEELKENLNVHSIRGLRRAGQQLGLKVSNKSKTGTIEALIDYATPRSPMEERAKELNEMSLALLRKHAKTLHVTYTGKNKEKLISDILECETENGLNNETSAGTGNTGSSNNDNAVPNNENTDSSTKEDDTPKRDGNDTQKIVEDSENATQPDASDGSDKTAKTGDGTPDERSTADAANSVDEDCDSDGNDEDDHDSIFDDIDDEDDDDFNNEETSSHEESPRDAATENGTANESASDEPSHSVANESNANGAVSNNASYETSTVDRETPGSADGTSDAQNDTHGNTAERNEHADGFHIQAEKSYYNADADSQNKDNGGREAIARERRQYVDEALREAEAEFNRKIDEARTVFDRNLRKLMDTVGDDNAALQKLAGAKHIADIRMSKTDEELRDALDNCRHSANHIERIVQPKQVKMPAMEHHDAPSDGTTQVDQPLRHQKQVHIENNIQHGTATVRNSEQAPNQRHTVGNEKIPTSNATASMSDKHDKFQTEVSAASITNGHAVHKDKALTTNNVSEPLHAVDEVSPNADEAGSDAQETVAEQKLPDDQSAVAARISFATDTIDDIIAGRKSYLDISNGNLLDSHGVASTVSATRTVSVGTRDSGNADVITRFDETINAVGINSSNEDTDEARQIAGESDAVSRDMEHIRNAERIAEVLYEDGAQLERELDTALTYGNADGNRGETADRDKKTDKQNVLAAGEPSSTSGADDMVQQSSAPLVETEQAVSVVEMNETITDADGDGMPDEANIESDEIISATEEERQEIVEFLSVNNDQTVSEPADSGSMGTESNEFAESDTAKMRCITVDDAMRTTVAEGVEQDFPNIDKLGDIDDSGLDLSDIEEPVEAIQVDNGSDARYVVGNREPDTANVKKTGWTTKASGVFRKKSHDADTSAPDSDNIAEPDDDMPSEIDFSNSRPNPYISRLDEQYEPISFDDDERGAGNTDATLPHVEPIDPNTYADTMEQVSENNPFVSVGNDAQQQAQMDIEASKKQRGLFGKLFGGKQK